MSEETKKKGEALMEAFNKLPDEKKEFLLGFASGYAEARAEFQSQQPLKEQSA